MRASLAYALLCAVALLAPALARVQLETPVGAVAGVEFTAAAADVAVAPQRLGKYLAQYLRLDAPPSSQQR